MGAWARVKTWGNEILYPADLNAEFNAGMSAYNTHRINATIDHPDESITPTKLDANASKNTITLKPQDVVLPASNKPALVQVNGTNNSFFVLDFDPNAIEKCFLHFTIPKNWDEGNVTVYFKYRATATSGAVVWQIKYRGISETEDIDPVLTEELILGTVSAISNGLSIAFENFPLTGVTAGEWLIFKVGRYGSHGADTLTVDARLLEVVIEWNI